MTAARDFMGRISRYVFFWINDQSGKELARLKALERDRANKAERCRAGFAASKDEFDRTMSERRSKRA